MYGVERTGVRFVLSNAADPSRADEYSAWYGTYGAGITRPGFLANAWSILGYSCMKTNSVSSLEYPFLLLHVDGTQCHLWNNIG